MDSLRLSQIAGRFAGQRILVAGDLMLDEFLWGRVSRISPEAPVPVVDVTSESYYPGGAANVARNVREFTTATALMGVAGADSHGDRLLALLAEGGIDTGAVAARRRAIHHRQDPRDRAPSAGGARGPRAQNFPHSRRDRARHRATCAGASRTWTASS